MTSKFYFISSESNQCASSLKSWTKTSSFSASSWSQWPLCRRYLRFYVVSIISFEVKILFLTFSAKATKAIWRLAWLIWKNAQQILININIFIVCIFMVLKCLTYRPRPNQVAPFWSSWVQWGRIRRVRVIFHDLNLIYLLVREAR